MTNFILGILAGSLLSAVVTIVAVRDPGVQRSLGLFLPELSRPPQPDRCNVPPRGAPSSGAQAGSLESLFDASRRLGPATRDVLPTPGQRGPAQAGAELD